MDRKDNVGSIITVVFSAGMAFSDHRTMNDPLPKVFLTRTMVPAVLERLQPQCDLQCNPDDRTLTHEELLSYIKDAVVLVSNGPDDINAAVLEAAPKLKLIANFGVGYNNIDVDTATRLSIAVS
ncbi:MAG: hypothetical protein O7C75_17015, partial [Verrucomicrobia bacterium]|nr:hypothetical protein [Verrucomicrobiota bacterium]